MFNFFVPVKCVSNLLPLSNGFTIPQLGFGTSNLSTSKAAEMVEYAIRCGFRHINCAKKYNNQTEIGRAIKKLIEDKIVEREHLFITTNVWCSGENPNFIRQECFNSLHELRLDYLDMCVLHWPRRMCKEYVCKSVAHIKDVKEICDDVEIVDDSKMLLSCWKEMNELVESKIVRSIGVANCNEEHLQKIVSDECTRAPVINQIEWHPAHVNYSLQTIHQQNEILTCALCPLGITSDNLTNNSSDSLLQDSTIKIMAERFGFTPARLLINWNANNGNVIVISSSNKEHIKDNSRAERYALHDAARIVLDSYHRFVKSYEVFNAKETHNHG